MINKSRLDLLLVNRGLIQSREKAKAIIMAGKVLVNNIKCNKPGTNFHNNVDIKIKPYSTRYVSRGGFKLEFALKENVINCQGTVCLDVGASSGGFTDCLIQNGASKIFAVDVGYGQLSWKLRQDPKVNVIERTNIRYIKSNLIRDKIDIATIDVSFISLKIVVPSILPFLADDASVIALIKPQFEVGRNNVGKNGVVKSKLLHDEVIKKLGIFFNQIGLVSQKIIQSPLLGPKGNREFLILLSKQKNGYNSF